MRIIPHAVFWESDELKKLCHTSKGRLFFKIWIVGQYGLCYLVVDPLHRIQGIHGSLKNHGDLLPPDLSHLVFALSDQILSFQNDLSTRDASVGRKQPHQGHPQGGLTASGLAHETQRSTLIQ